ncbi:hypothetical protein CSA37_06620 [Candidatus Fermentibacteria bacterium]|nr:MAG: hypothetical protein CSA37_06620 [Candidatus Fermentibacteria bacterium]
MSFLLEFVEAFWNTSVALAPSLIIGLLIAGLLHVFVKRGRISGHLGKPGLRSSAKASLLGIPLPLCSCGVLPAALALRKEGASKGATVSFLASTPQTGVDSIVPTWVMLGWPVALAKVLAAFIAGVTAGTITDTIEKGKGKETITASGEKEEHGSIPLRIWRYAFSTLFREIVVWLFIGITVSALITVFIQPGQLSEYSVLQGPLGVIAALAIGIPLYVCSVSSIPVAAALVYAGFPVGSALVFLMAGPVTNAATMTAVRKELGKTAFSSYILTVIAVSVLAGLLLNGLQLTGTASVHMHIGHSVAASAAGVFMLAAMLYYFVKDIMTRRKRLDKVGEAAQVVYSVTGMSCGNCVAKVRERLNSLPGVLAVEVSLENATATVAYSEGFSGEAALETIEKAGFSGSLAEGDTCGCDKCDA